MNKVILTTLLAALATNMAQAVTLTNSDWAVVAGETFTIKWTDAQGAVSIRLKSGPANSLQTVQEIASGHAGESFDWTVPTNLDTAQYAIEIEDSSGNINYSVQFSISGDSASPTTGSAEGPDTTTAAVATSTSLADVSSAATTATETEVASTPSEGPETTPETETLTSSVDITQRETATASTLTTTRANVPSATESDAAETDVPNSGNAGYRGSALMGAVVIAGALWLAY